MKLPDRIRDGLKKRITNYQMLMWHCFPADKYPRAWRCAAHGGPPGCAMAFNAALRKMGLRRNFETNKVEARK